MAPQEHSKVVIPVVCGVIQNEQGEYLIAKRSKPPIGWEFPGGKVELGESLSQALEREISEEFGLSITAEDQAMFEQLVDASVKTYQLFFVRASAVGDQSIKLNDHSEYVWAEERQFKQFDFIPGDQKFVRNIISNIRLTTN